MKKKQKQITQWTKDFAGLLQLNKQQLSCTGLHTNLCPILQFWSCHSQPQYDIPLQSLQKVTDFSPQIWHSPLNIILGNGGIRAGRQGCWIGGVVTGYDSESSVVPSSCLIRLDSATWDSSILNSPTRDAFTFWDGLQLLTDFLVALALTL